MSNQVTTSSGQTITSDETYEYQIGESYTLEANPDENSEFIGWQGSDDGTSYSPIEGPNGATYQFTVGQTNPKSYIKATFGPKQVNDQYTVYVDIETSDGESETGTITITNDESASQTTDGESETVVLTTGCYFMIEYEPGVGDGYDIQGISCDSIGYGNYVVVTNESSWGQYMGNCDLHFKILLQKQQPLVETCVLTYTDSTVLRNSGELANVKDLADITVNYSDDPTTIWYLVHNGVISDVEVLKNRNIDIHMLYTNGGINGTYGDYLDIDVSDWYVNGLKQNKKGNELITISVENNTNISIQLVNDVYVYYAYYHLDSDASVDDIPWQTYMTYSKIGYVTVSTWFMNQLGPNVYTHIEGYKCKKIKNLSTNEEYTLEQFARMQKRFDIPLDENGEIDYENPLEVELIFEKISYNIETGVFKRPENIVNYPYGSASVNVEYTETDQIATFTATVEPETANYKCEFDRWLGVHEDGSYYELSDIPLTGYTSETFVVTNPMKDLKIIACFKIIDKKYHPNQNQYNYNIDGAIVYQADHVIYDKALSLVIEPQDETTTSIHFKYRIMINGTPISITNSIVKTGVLVGWRPNATKKQAESGIVYDKFIGTCALSPAYIAHEYGAGNISDYNSWFDAEVTIDNLKPCNYYIVRPYVSNNTSIIYGDDSYIFTDIDPEYFTIKKNLPGLFLTQDLSNADKVGVIYMNGGLNEQGIQMLKDNPDFGEIIDNYHVQVNAPFVYFAPGNLRWGYIDDNVLDAHYWGFQFAEHQYDILTSYYNSQVSKTNPAIGNTSYSIDLFGWGTSGFYMYGSNSGEIAANRKYFVCSFPWSCNSDTLSKISQDYVDDYNLFVTWNNSNVPSSEKSPHMEAITIESLRKMKNADKVRGYSRGYDTTEAHNCSSTSSGMMPYDRYSFNYDTFSVPKPNSFGAWLDWGMYNQIYYKFGDDSGIIGSEIYRAMTKFSYNEAEYFANNHRKLTVHVTDYQNTEIQNGLLGYMYIPDNWKDKYTENQEFSSHPNLLGFPNYADVYNMTKSDVDLLTKYGVLFLPASGVRKKDIVFGYNTQAAYWTGVMAFWDETYDMVNGKAASLPNITGIRDPYVGKSVRLVTDANKWSIPTLNENNFTVVIDNRIKDDNCVSVMIKVYRLEDSQTIDMYGEDEEYTSEISAVNSNIIASRDRGGVSTGTKFAFVNQNQTVKITGTANYSNEIYAVRVTERGMSNMKSLFANYGNGIISSENPNIVYSPSGNKRSFDYDINVKDNDILVTVFVKR